MNRKIGETSTWGGRLHGVTAATTCALLAAWGCESGSEAPATSASSAQALTSPSADATLASLRGRFAIKSDRPGDFGAKPTSVTTPLLDASDVTTYGSGLAPTFRVGAPKVSGFAKPATTASGATELSSGALAIEVRGLGLSGATPVQSDGYLLYPGAAPGGGAIALRATPEGFEDYVVFESAPKVEAQEYALTLKGTSAGLRLIERTLEVLDADGAPRLRMRPPVLVDEKGKATLATVAVVGCAFDASPAPPWGRPVTQPGAATCTVRVAWSGLGVAYPAVLDPSWTTTGSLAQGRGEHSGTLLANGKILVVGGYSPVALGNELYDPVTGTWASTGGAVTRRFNHVATRLSNGKVLVAGGRRTTDWLPTATAELYDPATGTFTATGSMVSPRENFEAVALSSTQVLAMGGWDGGSVNVATAELYNVTAGTWSSTASMATGRAAHRASLLPNGKVLVTGGVGSTYLASAELFDPATGGSWSSAGSFSTARAFHAQLTLPYDGKVVVAGGHTDGTNTTPSVQRYDVATNTWQTAPALPTGRAKVGFTLLPNAEALFAGGQTSWNVFTTAVEGHDGATFTTIARPVMAQVRSNFPLVALDASAGVRALAVGGYTSTQYLAHAEVYDAQSATTSSPVEHEGISRMPLEIEWSAPNTRGTFAPSATLGIALTNTTDQSQSAYLDLTALGLDQRQITRAAFSNVTVPARSTTTVNVALSDFPLRPVGTDAQLVAQLRPHVGGVPTGSVWSINTPLHYRFTSDYTQVILHGALGQDLDRTQPAQSTTQAQWLASTHALRASLGTVTGKAWTAASGFVDVGTLPPVSDGARDSYAMRGQWAQDFGDLWPTLLMDYTAPNGKWYRFCPRIRADFSDVGMGEDYLVTPGIQGTPARYAHAAVFGPGDSTVWVGTLPADGCTPPLQLNPQDLFQVVWTSILEKTSPATTVQISWGRQPFDPNFQMQVPNAPEVYVEAFQPALSGGNSSGTAMPYDVPTKVTDPITRATAVLSRALDQADSGFVGGTYRVWADTGCIAAQPGHPGDACGGNPTGNLPPEGDGGYGNYPEAPFLLGKSIVFDDAGQPQAKGPHTTYSKFTIAHELGHTVFAYLFGRIRWWQSCTDPTNQKCQESIQTGLVNLPRTSEPRCRCDFSQAGNRIHCMQSKEQQGFAHNEGLAHFYAARLWNDSSQSDCAFAYYKDFLQLADAGVDADKPLPPPVRVDCFYGASTPQRWQRTYCDQSARGNKGVEWDWMTFLYELGRPGANAYSMSDLDHVYRRACNNSQSSQCSGETIFFDESAALWPSSGQWSLIDAANAEFGANQPKAIQLRLIGVKHRVNNVLPDQ